MSKISLDSITKGVEHGPIDITLYGPESVGKTHTACQAPGVIVVDLENGAPMEDVQKIPLYDKDVSFKDCLQALRVIYEHHKKLGVKTVVVDSFDWIQNLIDKEICAARNIKHISDLPYGQGYAMTADKATDFLNGLDSLKVLGLNIIVICHSDIRKVDEPMHDEYEIIDCKLHKKVGLLLKEWTSILAYCEFETKLQAKGQRFGKTVNRAVRTGKRIMHTVTSTGFVAKSRYPLPSPLPLDWKVLTDEINKIRKGVTNEN